jgi:hypothetical protein
MNRYVTGGIWGSEYALLDGRGRVLRVGLEPPWLLLMDYGPETGMAVLCHGERSTLEGQLSRYRKGPWPVALVSWPRELDVEQFNTALGTAGGIERVLAKAGLNRAEIFNGS